MTTLFNIPTTDCPTGQDAGAPARVALAGALTVMTEMIAPVGRRAR